MFRRAALSLLLSVLLPPITGRAAAPGEQIVFDQVTSKFTVAPDGTWTTDAEVSVRAPAVNPSHVVRIPLLWSASTEKLQVVQARIDKPDGGSTTMPNDIIREDPLIGDEYFHEFSDEKRLILTFPNVEPGDLLVIKTHREMFHPRVPGGFMAAPVLDRSVGWNDTNFTVSVPADMSFHYETRGFDHDSEQIKDRELHYFHSPRVAAPARDVAVLGDFDRLPRFAVSTFPDWDAFAKAYAGVFLPHAKVTPAITARAMQLTQGQADAYHQARALYDWVRDTIRYVPVPLEESKPEPTDADTVLRKGYGDAKDEMVLLYALLAARNIPAEFVVLNQGNDATIADPPNLRPMNHLILYLPGMHAYLDPTLLVAPFGVLAFDEVGKPAIHLDTRSGLVRRDIPMPASGATMSRLKTDLVFGADGTVTGTTTTTARGAFGVWLRRAARQFGSDTEAAAVTLLRQHGTPGSGSFSFKAPNAPGDDYTVTGTFQLSNQAALLHGGFFTLWTGLRILPRPGDVLAGPMFLHDLAKRTPSFCFPGLQTEEISMTLPPGRVLGGVPADAAFDTDLVHYRSHWTVDGQHVAVKREFQSLAPGPVCEGPVREDMADILDKMRADLLTPVGIRQDVIAVRPGDAPEAKTDSGEP